MHMNDLMRAIGDGKIGDAKKAAESIISLVERNPRYYKDDYFLFMTSMMAHIDDAIQHYGEIVSDVENQNYQEWVGSFFRIACDAGYHDEMLRYIRDPLVSFVPLLIGSGANINHANIEGETPLYEAIRTEQNIICKLLIELGASIDVIDRSGDSLAHSASTFGNFDALKMLFDKGINIEQAGSNGDTLLHCSVYSCDKSITEFLLEHGANINAVNAKGITPSNMLYFNGANGNNVGKLLATLLENGADYNATNHKGRPLFMNIAYLNNTDAIEVLLNRGFNINTNIDGRTLLHIASGAKEENIELLKMLLDRGADVNAISNITGDTALLGYFRYNSVASCDVLKLFLQKDLNLNITNYDGATLLNIFDPKGRTILQKAVLCEDIELVELLLDKGFNVNMCSNASATQFASKTPLHLAANIGNVEMCKLLVLRGADINAEDKDGCKPFPYFNPAVFFPLYDKYFDWIKLSIPNDGPGKVVTPLAKQNWYEEHQFTDKVTYNSDLTRYIMEFLGLDGCKNAISTTYNEIKQITQERLDNIAIHKVLFSHVLMEMLDSISNRTGSVDYYGDEETKEGMLLGDDNTDSTLG